MEGVRILNEISLMSTGIWVATVLFLAIGISSLSIVIFTLDKGDRAIPILLSLIPFVIAITLFLTECTLPTKYEAIIDDNVKISEFEKKYEIVEQRGDIYVIKERESNER